MCRRNLILTLILLIYFVPAFAQDNSLHSKAHDVFDELSEGKLVLHFFNALNGKGIPNADVNIEQIGDLKSDVEGRVLFASPIDNGTLKVSFQSKGYASSVFTIELMAGTIFFNRFSVSPSLLRGQIRIVLDWDKNPPDLDAHLVKQGAYHISYRDMKTSSDSQAQLDHDATTGYGPETITISSIDPGGSYDFFVHNFTDRNATNSLNLSESKATIKVFSSQGLIKIYHITPEIIGRYWKVFRIEHGEVSDVGEITN